MFTNSTRYLILALIMFCLLLCIAMPSSCLAIENRSERLSSDQASVFSPGYINATRQRTNEIINQSSKSKSLMENIVEYVKDKLSNDVSEDAANKVKPELKRKTSGTGEQDAESSASEKIPVGTTSLMDVETIRNLVAGTQATEEKIQFIVAGIAEVSIWAERDSDMINFTVKAGELDLSFRYSAEEVAGIARDWGMTTTYLGSGAFAIMVDGVEATRAVGGYDWMEYSYSSSVAVDNIFADMSRGSVDVLDYGFSNSYWQSSIFTALNSGSGSGITGLSSSDVKEGLDALAAMNFNPNSAWIIVSTPSLGNASVTRGNLYDSVSLKYNSSMSQTASYENLSNSALLNSVNSMSSSSVASILSGLLSGEGDMLSAGVGAKNRAGNSAGEAALAASAVKLNMDEMQIVAALSQIMNNPTEGQRIALDAVRALVTEIERINKESNTSTLKGASDDLLKVVVSILIAQAIPDLLSDGDVANIKSVFEELNASKKNIIFEYHGAIKPYYDEVKKLLLKNMAVLQLNNILSKDMTEEEMADLKPSELDKLMEKIKKAKKRSFEEEYILQQEAKYRNQYVDPNKKLLEDKIKRMISTFTGRLSDAMEGINASKK